MRLFAPLREFVRDGSCWRTCPASSLWTEDDLSSGSSVTWPRWGTWDGGALYELPTPELPTPAHASSSLLPTPAATNPNDGEDLTSWQARRDRERQKGRNGNGFGTPLSIATRLLPTPRTTDANGIRAHGDGGPDLRTVVSDHLSREAEALLPTPRARDGKGRDPNPRGCDLNEAVALLPTPRATDGTKGGPNQRGSSGDLMLPSAVLLLPTPTVADSRNGRNATAGRSPGKTAHAGQTLCDLVWSGDLTSPPSDGGSGSPDS